MLRNFTFPPLISARRLAPDAELKNDIVYWILQAFNLISDRLAGMPIFQGQHIRFDDSDSHADTAHDSIVHDTLPDTISHPVESTSLTRTAQQYEHEAVGDSVDWVEPEECPIDPSLAKYWSQRYRLFSRFDEGIVMDHGMEISTTLHLMHIYRGLVLSDTRADCSEDSGTMCMSADHRRVLWHGR